MTLRSWLLRRVATDAEVRTEIWRLGSRHAGRPTEGAIHELKAPGLTRKRALLLRACLVKLESRRP